MWEKSKLLWCKPNYAQYSLLHLKKKNLPLQQQKYLYKIH